MNHLTFPDRIVTIRLHDGDYDDCFSRLFSGQTAYHDATDFAADCASRIDEDMWDDCVTDNDGDLVQALNYWNERQVCTVGCGNPATITVSTHFSEKQILAACSGDKDWYRCTG